LGDLSYIERDAETKIVGQDSVGNQVNYVGADVNGNMFVLDYADGSAAGGTAATVSTLVGGIYNTTLPALTTGQQASLQLNSSGFLLVAPPLLVSPPTQNITVIDSASTTVTGANGQNFITGTPSAGSAASFVLSNEYTVVVQVTGTWTGTLQIEMSLDGGTTWSPNSVTQDGTNYTLNAFTGNFTGRANTVGYTNYRLRATAAITGTAVVRVTEAVGPSTVYINNAIKLVDNAGDMATITVGGSVNVNVTNTLTIAGALTNNNAAPAANNVGALTALAEGTLSATRYTAGNLVLPVVDLAGNTNVDIQYYLGAAVSKTNPIAATITDGTNVITAAISAYGTAPTGTEVMGVNAYITNVPAVSQSGTWNITNISGTISLPTGAATSALQTTGNTSLATIATNTALLTQGSTTSGQSGNLMFGAVTTNPPAYTTAESDPLSLTIDGDLRVADIMNTAGQYRAQSVTTTAAEALGGATILANRKSLTLTPTNGTIYWGFSNAVTITTGSPIFKNQSMSFAIGANLHIYVIAAATTDCRIAEGS
jgi:hypothetical protein